jgi:hypothetical protein
MAKWTNETDGVRFCIASVEAMVIPIQKRRRYVTERAL